MESNTKHTPGPWKVEERQKSRRISLSVFCKHGSIIAEIATDYEGLEDTENRANARLIAALPEVLDALESLVNDIDNYFDVLPDSFEQAKAAIKKATE